MNDIDDKLPQAYGLLGPRRTAAKAKAKAKAKGPPVTLSDLGGQDAPPPRRRNPRVPVGNLAKISEAAEWVEESSSRITGGASVDDEFEALFAEAGIESSEENVVHSSSETSKVEAVALLSRYGGVGAAKASGTANAFASIHSSLGSTPTPLERKLPMAAGEAKVAASLQDAHDSCQDEAVDDGAEDADQADDADDAGDADEAKEADNTLGEGVDVDDDVASMSSAGRDASDACKADAEVLLAFDGAVKVCQEEVDLYIDEESTDLLCSLDTSSDADSRCTVGELVTCDSTVPIARSIGTTEKEPTSRGEDDKVAPDATEAEVNSAVVEEAMTCAADDSRFSPSRGEAKDARGKNSEVNSAAAEDSPSAVAADALRFSPSRGEAKDAVGNSVASPSGRAEQLANIRQSYCCVQTKDDIGCGERGGSSSSSAPAPHDVHPSEEAVSLLGQGEQSSTHVDGGHREENDDVDLEQEWQDIGVRTDEMRLKEQTTGKVAPPDSGVMTPLTYREVEHWLRSQVVDPDILQPFYDEVVDDAARCGCFSRRRRKSDIPGLETRLAKDKDLLLYLKCCKFDFNDATHFRLLRTVYIKLSRNKTCPSIGNHWQQLGFQSGDPRTDLNRSGCVLNVLHMFYFFTHHFDVFKGVYLLAQDQEQNFPLACISINITGMVIEKFLAGKLSSLCNKSTSGVFETICKVHMAGLHYFYKQWRTQKRTIMDTEKTLNEIRGFLQSKPKRLLEELAKGVDDQKAKNDATRLEFTDMDFGGAKRPAAEVAKAKIRAAPGPKVPARQRNYVD